MENPSDQHRIKAIYQMLFEMATGNLTFRLEIGGKEDEIAQLSEDLNLLASRIHDLVLKFGYVSPHYSYQNVLQSTFVLDDELAIISFNSETLETLHYKPEELFKVQFEKVIATQSLELWKIIEQHALTDPNYHNTVHLIFLTANKKLLPSFCTVSRLVFSDKILVSSITTILSDLVADAQASNNFSQGKVPETLAIQKLYDYILNNLQEPLPTLKELSKMFKTNEYKLKQGFRELFNTSIYNFYNEERLKRAHQIIQQTNIPLKEIALISGFNSYLNFYKAFKKKFNYTPTEVARGLEDAD